MILQGWIRFIVIVLTAHLFSPQGTLAQDKNLPEPLVIPEDQFARLHTMIKPQVGELRFHDLPWLLSVWDARQKAAREGKPILVWSGSGGAPLGVC